MSDTPTILEKLEDYTQREPNAEGTECSHFV